MNTPQLECTDERRRLRHQGRECDFNGIDYVEASAAGVGPVTLTVHFQDVLHEYPTVATPSVWVIEGGQRSGPLVVTQAVIDAEHRVRLTIQGATDDSFYRLILLNPDLHGVDPHFSSFEFRFPGPVGSDLDDLDESTCLPRQFPAPQIDYLARDYGRLRRLLLDRLSVTMPDWKERHIPDIGVMLVELFAYIGDHLSYQQDAIATEAYLGTARQRVSVRRHARLVDYRLHEGCNARTFVHINAPAGDELDPDDVVFMAGLPMGDQAPPEAVSLTDLDEHSPPPITYFEAVQPPESNCFLNSLDLKNFVELMRRLESVTRGSLYALWLSLPGAVSLAISEALYSPPESYKLLTSQVIQALNISLRSLRLVDQLTQAEQQRCSPATRRRMATQCPHGCPATTNRAILEDLFPDLIARRVTQGDKIRLFAGHNEIRFYTWDGSRCWLPRGTTSATLIDSYLPRLSQDQPLPRSLDNLQVGDFLLLEEVRGSRTGVPADADPTHRQVVRLTRVTRSVDPVVSLTVPGEEIDPRLPIVEVQWHPTDALTFPLCLSARGRATTDCHLVEDISVARGNIILVDHGRTYSGEVLPCDEQHVVHDPCADPNCCGTCSSESPPQVAPRPFRPELKLPDLTFAQRPKLSERDDTAQRPMAASDMLVQVVHKAEPQLKLRGITPSPTSPAAELCEQNFSLEKLLQQLRVSPVDLCQQVAHLLPGKRCHEVASLTAWTPQNEIEQGLLLRLKQDLEVAITWTARNDLIDTPAEAREFTIEIDDQRRTRLRFPESGQNRPIPGSKFWATYRVGNGSAGNVGAGGITHLGFRKQSLTGRGLSVRNPLPALGGTDPEPLESARILAPSVTRKLKRAITEDDYRTIVLQEFPQAVQGAQAQLIPGPLGQMVRLAIDPYEHIDDFEELRREIKRVLDPFVRIGHDLVVVLADLVPIELALNITVQPGYYFEHVRAELLHVFSSGVQPNGKLGFFHPDLRTFGQGVYLSEVVASARMVTGVRGVDVVTLQRRDQPDPSALRSGVLSLSPLEVAVMNRSSRTHAGKLTILDSNKLDSAQAGEGAR